MSANLVMTTATRFDEIMSQPDVTVKSSTVGSEYITSVYRNGQILAERVIEVRNCEHYEVSLDEQSRDIRKSNAGIQHEQK